MLITRANATALLNQKEMELYTDSRVNTLRKLDARALTTRVRRARDARDRARDLVQRQKLASRDRTGAKRGTSGMANERSKEKATLLSDILSRFEAQLRQVEREDRKAAKAAEKVAASSASARKPASKRGGSAATRKAAAPASVAKAGPASAKSATQPKARAKKAASAASAVGKATDRPAKSPARKTRPAKKALTPEQALERTRELLEAKQAQARQPKSWETLGGTAGDAGSPGYQSEEAARRAEQLHEAEARIPAIQGSNSTRDRINQGKRDARRSPTTGN
ncbi:hypothetical protein CO641_05140 [Lysobacteraceae bacterium NML91-0213]|nr:hypothetical protein CO641_05140 [Xanthomonadaceae bacterium NML91-0213]